jgi:hypothetical protein
MICYFLLLFLAFYTFENLLSTWTKFTLKIRRQQKLVYTGQDQERFETIWNNLKRFEMIWNNLLLFSTFCHFLLLFVTFCFWKVSILKNEDNKNFLLLFVTFCFWMVSILKNEDNKNFLTKSSNIWKSGTQKQTFRTVETSSRLKNTQKLHIVAYRIKVLSSALQVCKLQTCSTYILSM